MNQQTTATLIPHDIDTDTSRSLTLNSTILGRAASNSTITSDTASITPDVHQFTCLSCHVAFQSSLSQREHYRSDWHRYNLKRKVVELPPVTADVFAQKIHQQTQKLTLPSLQACFQCQCCEYFNALIFF